MKRRYVVCGVSTRAIYMWLKPGAGGHGGILEDVYLGADPGRKYDILATSRDGLAAIAIGDAVFKSIARGEIIDLTEVMKR